jgi:hypothetical protein
MDWATVRPSRSLFQGNCRPLVSFNHWISKKLQPFSYFLRSTFLTRGNVQEITGLRTVKSVVTHENLRCILQAILTQSLACFAGDAPAGYQQWHK